MQGQTTMSRRQSSLSRSESPMKVIEFHPSQPESDSAGDSSLRYTYFLINQKNEYPLKISPLQTNQEAKNAPPI